MKKLILIISLIICVLFRVNAQETEFTYVKAKTFHARDSIGIYNIWLDSADWRKLQNIDDSIAVIINDSLAYYLNLNDSTILYVTPKQLADTAAAIRAIISEIIPVTIKKAKALIFFDDNALNFDTDSTNLSYDSSTNTLHAKNIEGVKINIDTLNADVIQATGNILTEGLIGIKTDNPEQLVHAIGNDTYSRFLLEHYGTAENPVIEFHQASGTKESPGYSLKSDGTFIWQTYFDGGFKNMVKTYVSHDTSSTSKIRGTYSFQLKDSNDVTTKVKIRLLSDGSITLSDTANQLAVYDAHNSMIWAVDNGLDYFIRFSTYTSPEEYKFKVDMEGNTTMEGNSLVDTSKASVSQIGNTILKDVNDTLTTPNVFNALNILKNGSELNPISYGSTTQIPYTNTTGDGFLYTSNFTTSSTGNLGIGQTLTFGGSAGTKVIDAGNFNQLQFKTSGGTAFDIANNNLRMYGSLSNIYGDLNVDDNIIAASNNGYFLRKTSTNNVIYGYGSGTDTSGIGIEEDIISFVLDKINKMYITPDTIFQNINVKIDNSLEVEGMASSKHYSTRIYINGAGQDVIISSAGVYYSIIGSSLHHNANQSYTDSSITVAEDGLYIVSMNCDGYTASNGRAVHISLFVDDVEDTGFEKETFHKTSNENYPLDWSGTIILTAGTVLEPKIKYIGVTGTYHFSHFGFDITRIN